MEIKQVPAQRVKVKIGPEDDIRNSVCGHAEATLEDDLFTAPARITIWLEGGQGTRFEVEADVDVAESLIYQMIDAVNDARTKTEAKRASRPSLRDRADAVLGNRNHEPSMGVAQAEGGGA